MKRFLLDTNILLGFVRGAHWAKATYESLEMIKEENLVFTATICRGELLALSEKLGWGEKKRAALESTLYQFTAVGVDKESISKAYARIDAWSRGKALDEEPFTSPPKPAKKMGQNDMWIAAVALMTGATLVTADGDFDHLADSVIPVVKVDQTEGFPKQ